MKKKITLFILILITALTTGCLKQNKEVSCIDNETGGKLSLTEARQIAQSSECVIEGTLTENSFCNNGTGTWWIDLDINKPGCAPACVININTGEAYINWRCTGAMPTSTDLPEISIEVGEQRCEPGNEYIKFFILRDNQIVNSLNIPNCSSTETEILLTTNNAVYFSILPTEVGGYILFGKYVNLYRLNFIDNVGNTLLEQNYLTDIDIASDESQIVFLTGDSSGAKDIMVKELPSGEAKLYGLPTQVDNAQFGDFKFSPNLDKVAIAVGYGPVDEKWEIYILNLVDGSYSLYDESTDQLNIEGWVNNDELIIKQTHNDYPSP